MKLFESAVFLGESIELGADNRPPELLGLRDATHPTCPYYRFLYELSRQLGPFDSIEIGTYVGTSAAHLAAPGGTVFTIDTNPDAKIRVDTLQRDNITAVTGDSLRIVEEFKFSQPFDVLYVDGLHNFSQAYREYFHYREIVREGGLMIFDDVNLEMDGDEMNILWGAIPEPKHRLDHLHTTGFGIVEKRSVTVTPPPVAMDQAAPIIRSRQRRA